MDNKQEFALLIEEITVKTAEFLSLNASCVDENGVLHPLFEDILQRRDVAVTVVNQYPEVRTVLAEAERFYDVSQKLSRFMEDEFASIKQAIMKRNQAKQLNTYYGNQAPLGRPIFFNDFG